MNNLSMKRSKKALKQGMTERIIMAKKCLIFLLAVLAFNANATDSYEASCYEANCYVKIDENSVPRYEMLGKEIGYIRLASFNSKAASETREAINALKKQGLKKLVLDLRSNPGGLLTQATEVGELFLKKGDRIISAKGRVADSEINAAKDGILDENTQIAVLVNRGTAGAAEIVAGALQDWKRAAIVGKTTFGGAGIQTIMPFYEANETMKLTTAFYCLPSGRSINGVGITPDIDVEQNTGDAQLEAALKYLRKEK